jgi:membrane glycosyltransferase
VLLEIMMSSLLAPIRMVFHSRFVLQNLLGRTVIWRSQGRDDTETGWAEAIRHHGVDTVVACAWGGTLFWLNPDYFWWVTPIIGALILSIPLSVLASRVGPGERARARGLFLIPEEIAPPTELREVEERTDAAERETSAPVTIIDCAADRPRGFARAALDPRLNAICRALLGAPRRLRGSIRAARDALVARAVAEGPGALTPGERAVVLRDPQAVDELHTSVWTDRAPERWTAI